jgi:peptidoglycan/xylan/chitin deacetylase (PgdA/CDA1 family)
MPRTGMYRIIFGFCIFIGIVSCATSETERAVRAARDPSSEIEIENENEVAFQLMMQDERIQPALQLKVDQVEEVFYRANDFTQEFDRLLSESTAKNLKQNDFMAQAIRSGIYPRLMALQVLGEEVRERLTYVVNRMNELGNNPNTDAVTKEKLAQGWTHLRRYLAETPNSTRLALNPWAEEMKEILPNQPDLQRGYKHLLVGQPEALIALGQEPKVLEHLKYLTGLVKMKPGLLRSRMEDIAATLKPDLEENAGLSRQPQSAVGVLYGRTSTRKSFSLAFEGGPDSRVTLEILEALRARKAKATFFVTTSRLAGRESIAHKAHQAGMRLENGTGTRPELTKLYDQQLIAEIQKSNDTLKQLSGSTPQFIKLPYNGGSRSDRVKAAVRNTNLRIVIPQIESLSWNDWDPAAIVKRVKGQMRLAGSGMISFDDRRQVTPAALKRLFQAGPEAKFVSIEEAVR